jgi:L-ribulose-5-phosphate 4-epimerase
MKEGVIKFRCDWKKRIIPADEGIDELIKCRNKLFIIGFVGVYDNGIGYGNVSIRIGRSNKFVITGSQTGKVKRISRSNLAIVEKVDIVRNYLKCKGKYPASSESISHHMLYKLSKKINAVIHIHNLRLWKKYLNKFPTTIKKISYGTVELGNDIKRLWNSGKLKKEKILIMGGHKEGIIVFGENLDEAMKTMFNVQ